MASIVEGSFDHILPLFEVIVNPGGYPYQFEQALVQDNVDHAYGEIVVDTCCLKGVLEACQFHINRTEEQRTRIYYMLRRATAVRPIRLHDVWHIYREFDTDGLRL